MLSDIARPADTCDTAASDRPCSLPLSDATMYIERIPRRLTRLSVRGCDYAVSEWGNPNRPPMVYLHGWGDTGSTFQFVVDALPGDSFVVAPDWRGFGRSASGTVGAYWFPDYLADLDHLLAHYSPEQSVRLIGHSMGGNIASLYAGVMPERVEALINLEGFGLPDGEPTAAPARYRDWIRQTHAMPTFSSYRDHDELAERLSRRSPLMNSAQALFVAREWAAVGPDGRVHLRADPAHKLPNPVLYRRAEAEACWREIQARVLLVEGSDSDIAADTNALAAMAAEVPDSRRLSIEGVGHMLHFDRPAAVAAAAAEFFGL